MIKELAAVLGMDESSLHSAIHRAAYDSGWRDGDIAIEWTRDFISYSTNGMWMEHDPYPTSVVIMYGATEKVTPAYQAAAATMRAESTA